MLAENTRHSERQAILFARRKDKIQKTKRETTELGMETHPGEEVMKEKFPNSRRPSHRCACGEFWNLSGQHNGEREKKTNPQNTCLTTTASGEVAQILLPPARGGWAAKYGMHKSLLRVRTGPECPEENLRELT